MPTCCETFEATAPNPLPNRVLWVLLAINGVMFLAEFAAGLLSHSTALLADSLDMLGDSAVYALTLFALGKGTGAEARVSLAKGAIMLVFAFVLLAEGLVKNLLYLVPEASVIGAMGLLALLANATCALLLVRHRSSAINLRSAWICSRNDLLANLGILLAAGGVAATGSAWPDIAVGAAIALLFFCSATGVIRDSLGQLRRLGTA